MTAVEIPACVFRGLATMTDGDLPSVRYRSEADLRDAMAAIWWLHGWTVRTEVKVPDCGRIDVLASVGAHRVLIEVKKRIDTPTLARQAFQQAHAYLSYLDADLAIQRMRGEDRPPTTALVTAGEYDSVAAERAEDAYIGSIRGAGFWTTARVAQRPPHFWRDDPDQAVNLRAITQERQVLVGSLTRALRTAEINHVVRAETEALRQLDVPPELEPHPDEAAS